MQCWDHSLSEHSHFRDHSNLWSLSHSRSFSLSYRSQFIIILFFRTTVISQSCDNWRFSKSWSFSQCLSSSCPVTFDFFSCILKLAVAVLIWALHSHVYYGTSYLRDAFSCSLRPFSSPKLNSHAYHGQSYLWSVMLTIFLLSILLHCCSFSWRDHSPFFLLVCSYRSHL